MKKTQNEGSYLNCHSNEHTYGCRASNILIKEFYSKNKHINFEQANISLINLFNMSMSIDIDMDSKNINQYYEEKENTTYNSIHSTEVEYLYNFEFILNKINPMSTITNMDNYSNCNFLIVKDNNQPIIIGHKEIEHNVSTIDIDLFEESCKKLKHNGIFISQKSGIVNK